MDPNGKPHSKQRETLLTVVLTVLGIAAFLVFSLVILSPFLAQTLGAVVILAVIAGFGCLHYWLWGRSMSQEVAGERAEEEQRAAAEADDWPFEQPQQYRRF